MTLFQNPDHPPLPELELIHMRSRDRRLAIRHIKISRRLADKGTKYLERARAKMDDPRERIDQKDWLDWSVRYAGELLIESTKHIRLADALIRRMEREERDG